MDDFPQVADLGCHEAEVPRALLPEEKRSWEMAPSSMRTITRAALRWGTEGDRKVRRWRPS